MHETTTFVIQDHHSKGASKHHFDFRIKKDKVLKSWAIPKHKFPDKGERLMAVQVPDHDLDWEDFRGEILTGYGRGKVEIHDKGTCIILQWSDNKIGFQLKGSKIRGTFWLIRMVKEKRTWLLLRSS